jgi:DNA relaxase NicK
MKTNGHVDWLSATFPLGTTRDNLVPEPLRAVGWRSDGPGLHGYARSERNDLGAIILSDGTPEQGIHVILPGEALAECRAEGVTDRALCVRTLMYGGRASRLDLAVDVIESAMTVADLRGAYQDGKCETNARVATEVSIISAENDTLYIGSRSSHKFFRAYNKGAQVGSQTAWLRLELECKRVYARGMLGALADAADQRPVINAALRAYADFPTLPDYLEALADCDANLPQVPRRISNTYRWLLEQVAPCLARYQFIHPDFPVEQAFLTAWHVALERLVLYSQPPDHNP